MYQPRSTYRIQFHKDFTLAHLEQIIDYLTGLGVGTLYASPIFEATPGSTHGYDALNPLRINPEVGTEAQLRAIAQKLRQRNIGWIQDIVPNHMAFDPRNPWLFDVLEKGTRSLYASYFDIGWDSSVHNGKLMAPFMGNDLETVVAKGELKLIAVADRLLLQYYESAYPLHPRSYQRVLNGIGKKTQALQQLLAQLGELHTVEDKTAFATQWNEWRAQWQSLQQNKTTGKAIAGAIEAVNENKSLLLELANEQAYRLCHWQETDQQINFRRFFTVNGLICLNIQDGQVFAQHHALVQQLVQDEVFQGLRIDHIDGLYDPTAYLERLRALAGTEAYIVVEKILEPGEQLPAHWPIEGSSGYDFLAQVNNLLTQTGSLQAFTRFYQKLATDPTDVHLQIHEKKAYILHEHMAGELDNLLHLFLQSGLVDRKALSHIHHEDLRTAIAELLIHCPVYRYYANRFPLSIEEAGAVQDIFNSMRKANAARPAAIGVLEDALLHQPPLRDAAYHQKALHFYQRCMQFTGPLMAKGVEDTIMYTYNRFIGHNEVGDAPDAFGLTVAGFHQQMQFRQQHWPLALNGTSTHDTKRGEDVRARLNVLTDIPDIWLKQVQEWQQANASLPPEAAPDANDAYFIYQTITGAYPMPGMEEDDFGNRLSAYLQKALREAKRHSNWTEPNETYESAAQQFARALLRPDSAFWKSFVPFHRMVCDAGIVNSLVQVLLKFTCPGVPDVYQGCEFWDLSLVDPDNRRAADYPKRMEALQFFADKDLQTLLPELWDNRFDGRIKLWLTQQLAELRHKQPYLFSEGDYVPLAVSGTYQDHIIAFARKHREQVYVVAAPLHVAPLCLQQNKSVLELDWKDTRIALPEGAAPTWQLPLTKATETTENGLAVQGLFRGLPLALLQGRYNNNRGAGILLHLTSLPSPFGIGDMGREARLFADFLFRSNQKYWQLLPLNPTEAGQGQSPYSSISSRAGNPLLISPRTLAEEGWLLPDELQAAHLPPANKVDYNTAAEVKEQLFQKAFVRFREQGTEAHHADFVRYCSAQQSWLEDFALYGVLKKEQGGAAWFQWPDPYKNREPEALAALARSHASELEYCRWLQWLFARQWQALRTYCNNQGISLVGDLPIYVSYDSVDVWSHRGLFALDAAGAMTGMAGTPPDAFSDEGQLWGMPVFRWDVLAHNKYAWWVDRLRHNTELFDLVRIDHFRAFADYWEVPAGAESARGGSWQPGPGAGFFTAVQEALGGLPFIAEDLGEINKAVTDLRDQFHLPGMKILLFAFGEAMAQSDYIPHNYSPNFVVYTGTHDNNTVRGWYEHEADDATRSRLEAYVGRAVSAAEVHLILAQMAYASVAKTCILPMQDLLGLGQESRMNMPGQATGNWAWRLLPGQINEAAEDLLRKWTGLYNR